VLGVCLTLAGSARAAGERGSQIEIETRGCPAIDVENLRHLLELEWQPTNQAGKAKLRVSLECDGGQIGLSVSEASSERARSQAIDVESTPPETRERVVALTIAELATDLVRPPTQERPPKNLDSTPDPLPAPKPPSLDSATPAESASESSSRSESLRVEALASARTIASTKGWLLGGGARLGGPFLEHWGYSTDLIVERGRLGASAGVFEVDVVTLGAAIMLEARSPGVSAGVGLGVRAGLTSSSRIEGAGPPGASTLAPWGWPMLAAALRVEDSTNWLLELSGEGGYTLLPLTAGGSRVGDPALSGLWFGIELGLGFHP
jgi:hypothetical protein